MSESNKKYSYRLIEDSYCNYCEPEDGTGSLTNILSDLRTRVMREWHDRDEKFGEWLVKHVVESEDDLDFESDSADGRDEYSYKIERRENGTSEWRYVGQIRFPYGPRSSDW